MTNSLYQNIQALGNRMVSNLETMGVSASFQDGGLTLADKILEIQSLTDGIFLFSTKNIIQSNNSVGLTALIVEDGELVDTNISIYDMYSNLMTSASSEWKPYESAEGFVYSSSGATLSGSNWVYLNRKLNVSENSHIIEFDCKPDDESPTAVFGQIYTIGGSGYYENFDITENGVSFCDDDFNLPSGITWGEWIHVKLEWTPTQQKIYIDDTLAGTTSHDWSDSSIYEELYLQFFNTTTGRDFIIKNVSVNTIVASGGHGACTGSYTGAGVGVRTFKAVSEGVVSQPYTVLDCFFIDNGITGDNNNTYWSSYSDRTTVGETGTTVTNETFIKKTTSSSLTRVWTEDMGIEFDVVSQNSTYFLIQLYDGTTNCSYRIYGTGHCTVENIVGQPIVVKMNGETVNPSTSGNNKVSNEYRVGFQLLGTSTELVFKNWHMWYI